MKSGGDGGAAAMRADEEARRQRQLQATASVNDAFKGFDDNYFSSIADEFMKFQTPLFEEQLTKARRDLPLRFASTDNSDYQRTLAELERDSLREQANLRDQATTFANQQRQSVEQNRADLLGQATSAGDVAASASQAAARAAALAKPPAFSPIADLFQKYTANAANQMTWNANQPQNNRAPALTFNPNSNAVRVVR